ncbi:MAG: flagellar basal-body MS-ring/collar protein FliF [Bacteroidota bacterium]
MNKYAEAFQQFFGPLSYAQRAMFVALVLVIVSMVAGLLFWSQQEDYALLFGSMQPEVAQDIVSELKNRGISYEISESSDAIYVPSDQVHELRLELAPMGGGVSDLKGYELFDTNALGMTDFMQQVNKKRALEGELARSINSLEQVDNSRIHLVLPERSPFEESAVEASASVILNLKKGMKLKDDQIDGITALIAGSVESLEQGSVTVLDQAGNRLTDKVNNETEFGQGSMQIQLRQKTEAYLTERGQSMLDRVLGAGNSILRVSVQHDFDRLVRESDLIDPDSRTIISEDRREQSNNDEAMEPLPIDQRLPVEQRGGAVVVASNDNSSTVQTRNYEVNRTREVFEKTQGEIKTITASVLLNFKKVMEVNEDGNETITYEPYPEREVKEFEEVVMLALGLQQERGDELTIKQVEFFDREVIPTDGIFASQPTYTNDIIRWSLIGISFLVSMFLINGLRKQLNPEEMKTVTEFSTDARLEGGDSLRSLPPGASPDLMTDGAEGDRLQALLDGPSESAVKKYNKEEIVNYIELKPAEAAQVLRALMDK